MTTAKPIEPVDQNVFFLFCRRTTLPPFRAPYRIRRNYKKKTFFYNHTTVPKTLFNLPSHGKTLFPVASAAISSTTTPSSRGSSTRHSVAALRGGVLRPVAATSELAQVAAVASASSVLTFGGVVAGLAAVSKLSANRIESRVDDAIKKAETYGIDLTDLYYDFDVPVGLTACIQLKVAQLLQSFHFSTETFPAEAFPRLR